MKSEPKTHASATHELLSALLGELVGPALVCDRQLVVVAATLGAVELLGRDPTGMRVAKALGESETASALVEAIARGSGGEARLLLPSSDDETREIVLHAVPLTCGDDDLVGTLVHVHPGAAAARERDVLFQGMWTREPSMKEVFRLIERVAADDVTVLVRGETGTGKELVARAIHELSPRKRGPFRAINCAALPPQLLESELFGHTKGAFTGAVKDTPGHVQLAHKGTLFLDEVAELPLELQAKLLRVIETHTVLPVGGRDPIPVDVRIVSATHRALRKEVEEGRFRADLMYRLRVIPVFLPALRERPEDIELLADKIVLEMNRTRRRTVKAIAPSALKVLRDYDWPGNVRELRNVLAYAFAVGDGPRLEAHELPPELLQRGAPHERSRAPAKASPKVAASPQASRILHALESASGNREQAARLLGMSRVTLWRRMKALGLDGAL